MTTKIYQRDDVNEASSTGDAVIHVLKGHYPRKFITLALSCEAAVIFHIDFSTDQGATYPIANRLTIEMDGAGSDIRNLVNERPGLTHIKVTPDRAGTYTVRTALSDIATEINANMLVDGVAVTTDSPVPQEQIIGGAVVSATNPVPVNQGASSATTDSIDVSKMSAGDAAPVVVVWATNNSQEIDMTGYKHLVVWATTATAGTTLQPKSAPASGGPLHLCYKKDSTTVQSVTTTVASENFVFEDTKGFVQLVRGSSNVGTTYYQRFN